MIRRGDTAYRSYTERFAQEALGHNSKAHRAYARKAKVVLSSTEPFDGHVHAGDVLRFPSAKVFTSTACRASLWSGRIECGVRPRLVVGAVLDAPAASERAVTAFDGADRLVKVQFPRVRQPHNSLDRHVLGFSSGRRGVREPAFAEGVWHWGERILVGGKWADEPGHGQPMQRGMAQKAGHGETELWDYRSDALFFTRFLRTVGSKVLLSRPAVVELAFPFHVERFPAGGSTYQHDLRANCAKSFVTRVGG